MSALEEAVEIYYERGWTLIPVSAYVEKTQKHVRPPGGVTGRSGRAMSAEEVRDHIRAGWNSIAIRCPENVIGIDIDVYGEKRGDADIDMLSNGLNVGGIQWTEGIGALPVTWTSTARDIRSGSGIRWYRVPPGRINRDPKGSIETIRHDHRFAVVGPSVHPATRTVYRWYDTHGSSCPPPFVSELPDLPEAWVEYLSGGGARSSAGGGGEPATRAAGDTSPTFMPEWMVEAADNAVRKGESRHKTLFSAAVEFAYAGADTAPLKRWAMNLGLPEWDVDRHITNAAGLAGGGKGGGLYGQEVG